MAKIFVLFLSSILFYYFLMSNTDNNFQINSDDLYRIMKQRRSSRFFKDREVSLEDVKNCIRIAGSAPSGANMQPWNFVLVTDMDMKKKIREEAEKTEKVFYEEKISDEWRKDLEALKTNCEKPFLTEAPCLICIFLKRYDTNSSGNRKKVYYPNESVGIATGFLISALHLSGYSTLTYTPAPMSFLGRVLNRPENERPFMILPVGYADEQNIEKRDKKNLDEILTVI